MNTGETIALIKALGGGGSSLPSVTSSDNGKVLAVENGAWAARNLPTERNIDEFIQMSGTYENGGITVSCGYTTDEFVEKFLNGCGFYLNVENKGAAYPVLTGQSGSVLVFDVRFAYTGSGHLIDYDRWVLMVNLSDSIPVLTMERWNGKFIVTLTPTAPDYSGTMDKTVAEINAAYEAGQEIVFRVMTSATVYMDVDCTARGKVEDYAYPSFNAYIIDDTNHVIIYAYTGVANDGTKQTYSTAIYSLTPAS